MFVIFSQRKNLKTGEDSNQDVTLKDVHEEVNNLLTERFKIMRFRARKVTKRYCFDIAAVPDESDYLEVRYSVRTVEFMIF